MDRRSTDILIHRRVFIALVSLLCLLLPVTTGDVAAENQLIEGDAAAGRALYQAQCVSCHGVAGGSVIPTQPILSGQFAEYTYAQLQAFKNRTRNNPVMMPLADLTDEEMRDVAVYLSGQQLVIAGASDEALALQGQALYRAGAADRSIPSCAACHGPAGAGIAPLYPRISGQHAQYIVNSMNSFRNGDRDNEIMNAIAKRLTDEEIAALSEYISGLSY